MIKSDYINGCAQSQNLNLPWSSQKFNIIGIVSGKFESIWYMFK